MIKKIFKSKEKRAGLVYSLTNFFNAALPFFLLSILTFKLTEVEYGIIAMVLVFVSIVLHLITLGVTSSISPAYFRNDINHFPQYLDNCLLMIFLAFITVKNMFSIRPAYGMYLRYINHLLGKRLNMKCV